MTTKKFTHIFKMLGDLVSLAILKDWSHMLQLSKLEPLVREKKVKNR